MGADGQGPVVYVSHSQLYHGETSDLSNARVGWISKLSGANMDNIETLVSNLPVSNHDHAVNGMTFHPNGNLYVSIGGNTNAGIPGAGLGWLEEDYFSGCIIGINMYDTNFDGIITYDTNNFPITPDTSIFVHAAGLRNSFDLTYHPNGNIYATDNGPNVNFGEESTECTTQTNDPGAIDKLVKADFGNYHGHPNRLRGSITYSDGSDESRQCIYRDLSEISTIEYTAPIETFSSSTNGIAVYYPNTFGAQWKGDLILGRYVGVMHRVILSTDGETVQSKETLSWTNGLDVAVRADGSVFCANRAGGSTVKYIVPDDDPTQYSDLFVISIWPNMGPVEGGRDIVIRGYNFDATISVEMNGNPCGGIVVGQDGNFDIVSCTTPATNTVGPADVRVTLGNGDEFEAVDLYVYVTKNG